MPSKLNRLSNCLVSSRTHVRVVQTAPSGYTSARGAQQPSKLKNAEFDSPYPLQFY